MRHAFLVLLMLLLSMSMLLATIYQYYTFSASTGTYSAITGTAVTSIQQDDALSEAIPIGFTFVYGDMPYTQVKISSNGWIGLGTVATDSNLSNNLSFTTSFPYIAPLWDDLSLVSGNCQYATIGTAPNRAFIVQYQNAAWNYSATNQFNFQAMFYESGKIEFYYGTSSGTPSQASASIGININPGGPENYYSVTPGTPASASYLTENASINTFPGNGVIYTFDVLEPVPNDLAALSITGNTTPSVGSVSNYVIAVRNSGTSSQNTYTVQLMSGTTILASVAGPAISPSEIIDVTIGWTPAATGLMTIYGKVVLAGDAYPQNDNSAGLNINVQEAGTIAVTVGDGNELANIPVNMFWRNSLFETIYQTGEILASGMITGISFYNNFETNLPQMPTKIFLGLTTQSDLSAGWIPATELVQVFDGLVDYPVGQNTITIPLSTPFMYPGGNLVLMANRPMDTTYYSSMDQFQSQTVGTDRSLLVYDDNTLFDPFNPPAGMGELSGQFPKTTFYLVAGGTDPQFGIAPENKNYGTVLLNSSHDQAFNAFNIGGGSLTISSITISGSPFFTLSNLPTLPVSLTSGQITSFNATYHPTAAGSHSATITLVDNLARLEHTVQLTGTCIDPNIYTSPYVQHFDTVSPPNLPIDWNYHISPTGMGATVSTINSFSHSTPNSVQLYNDWDQTTNIFLVSPPLSMDLNLNAMRVKFWSYDEFSDGTLVVGVIADINDAATFTPLETVNVSPNWQQHIVSLFPYTGTGRRIAFKHGNLNWYEYIHIDDVTIETTPANDLEAVSVSGNSTPTAGTAANYTINIKNWGTNAQTNYTVKLFLEGDIEIASTAGPAVNPDATASVVLSWTPSLAGNTYIYGKVVLTGDENNQNDQSPNFNVVVQETGTTAVTIGTGDQLNNIPVNMYWKNSLYETIYQSGDIAAGGMITGIAFYNDFVTNLPQKPTKLWLGMTTQDELSNGWIAADQLTQVFDGLVDYPSGQNMIVIPFTTPVAYAGTNLVLMANRPMDTQYFDFEDCFQCQTGTFDNSLEIHSDTDNFDPLNPPATGATLSGQYPKTTLFFAPSGPDPMFGVAPQSKNFGTVLMNQTYTQTFTVFNSGGAPLTINSIVLSGSPMFSLQNLPTLPLVLNSGQNATFIAQYLPTAAGAHTGTITITDNLTRSRTEHSVALSGNCIDPTIYTSPYFQDFDDVTAPDIPIDWQKIYQGGTQSGFIQTVDFEAHSTPNCVQMYNSQDANPEILLIAPPLSNDLPVTAMRVKFYAKSDENYDLQVGVITTPTDPATFQSISTQTLSNNWEEYLVSFQTYAGAGHYIAFKHGLGGTWRSIYIDDVTIETTPQNDLAALSLTGNSTPSVGMATNYTVNIFNWGTNPQTDYTVKLYKQGDIELATTAGPAINPGLTAQATLSWAPAVQEQTYLYAKVILTGDQNNLNDQTPDLNVSVQPAGTMVVTVGDGNEQARMPVDMYYHNSLFETVFLSSELNFIGMITGISFYNNFETNLPNMPVNVFLGETTQTDLSSGWIPSTNMTQVYSGNVDFPSGSNTIIITFPEQFLYLGGNLVLMVERVMDTTYYSSMDQFYCQTVGSNRTRNIYSDWEDYDPASPPTEGDLLTGQFPKTSLMVIPGGVGHLTGTVYGAGDIPLPGATVQIVGGAQVTTDTQGHYLIQNLIAGDYDVNVSAHGYIDQTLTVTIPEDSTVTQDFTLNQMPMVSVTGTICGSDNPTVGLVGATFSLTGYDNYEGQTDGQGQFIITDVYANQTYDYIASALGYQVATGTINVTSTNYDMGDMILSEIAYTPRNVSASEEADHQSVTVTWLAPDPNSVDIDQSYEGDQFPPSDWTQIITNNGPANVSGVYPTWCRFGEVISGTTTVTPSDGDWQCGFWWDFNHQDEWLITPSFNCPQGASLSFDTYAFYGSPNDDHYYVKISNNNGVSWTVLWDASDLTGGWNNYQTPVIINLAAYTGQQVKLAWHADDPNTTNDGMWYNWFIDNVQVSNVARTIRFPESSLTVRSVAGSVKMPQPVVTDMPLTRATDSRSLAYGRILPPADNDHTDRIRNRSLEGYLVWRLVQGQEQNETTWVSLTPSMITALTLSDTAWNTLEAGTYKWAVKSVYTNDVLSLAAFSNPVVNAAQMGLLAGMVRNAANQPILGATIVAGGYTTTSAANGSYSMAVPAGTYSVTCTAPGYQAQTQENIVIIVNQTTVCNFILPVSNEDIVAVECTALKHNYPNPFNPETAICYDIKDIAPVRIEIFNAKGQLVRTLVDEMKSTGHFQVIWNGRDDAGKPVASGVYTCRMNAGEYKAVRRMMLLK